MARIRVLSGTQKYKEPSSCLGPFGDPGPSVGEVEGGLGGVHRTRQSAVRVHRSKKGVKRVYDQRVRWLREARTAGGANCGRTMTCSTRKLPISASLVY